MMKRILGIAVAAVLMGSGASALAAGPSRPECVAPARPGGGFDLTCRIAVQAMEAAKALNRPMAVTYMPGGIGAVAYNVYNTTKAADPNAIVAFSTGSILNMVTGKFGNWGVGDARYIATAGTDYGAVVVRNDSPFRTLGDLMAKLTADPTSVVLGAGGSVGSQDWMKAALLARAANVDPRRMRYVAFEGGGDAITNLLGGNIQAYTGDAGEMMSHLGDGQMRILAVLAPERLPGAYAQIPTAKEAGFDVTWAIYRGFYMGKNVPDEAYNFYVDAFRKASETEAFRQIQEAQGLFPFNKSADELRSFLMQDAERMREVALSVGLISK
jgi:putative tricarboxylic transport membrane protein